DLIQRKLVGVKVQPQTVSFCLERLEEHSCSTNSHIVVESNRSRSVYVSNESLTHGNLSVWLNDTSVCRSSSRSSPCSPVVSNINSIYRCIGVCPKVKSLNRWVSIKQLFCINSARIRVS